MHVGDGWVGIEEAAMCGAWPNSTVAVWGGDSDTAFHGKEFLNPKMSPLLQSLAIANPTASRVSEKPKMTEHVLQETTQPGSHPARERSPQGRHCFPCFVTPSTVSQRGRDIDVNLRVAAAWMFLG